MKLVSLTMLIALLILSACSKEGTGGDAVISGTVYESVTDHNGKLIEKRVAQDKKVFITYGDNTFQNDDIDTDVSGNYEFKYLLTGNYTIHAYSDCNTCTVPDEIITSKITLESSSDNKTVDLTIVKKVRPDKGTSTIKGRLMVQKYLGITPFGAPYPAQKTDVFIVYDTDDVYFFSMDTGSDGKFEFRNLIMGAYTVYAYSQCDTCSVTLETESVTGTISANNTTVDLGDLTVETQ